MTNLYGIGDNFLSFKRVNDPHGNVANEQKCHNLLSGFGSIVLRKVNPASWHICYEHHLQHNLVARWEHGRFNSGVPQVSENVISDNTRTPLPVRWLRRRWPWLGGLVHAWKHLMHQLLHWIRRKGRDQKRKPSVGCRWEYFVRPFWISVIALWIDNKRNIYLTMTFDENRVVQWLPTRAEVLT